IPVPPKIENHNALNIVGTANTPIMNSRMVRPSETRAINVPTKGDQAIDQAQEKMVQPSIHSSPSSLNGVRRQLICGSVWIYLPIVLVNKSNKNVVGPMNKKKNINKTATAIFALLKYFIPRPIPEIADPINKIVTITIMIICVEILFGILPFKKLSPPLI